VGIELAIGVEVSVGQETSWKVLQPIPGIRRITEPNLFPNAPRPGDRIIFSPWNRPRPRVALFQDPTTGNNNPTPL
jgi:hypothetical protein